MGKHIKTKMDYEMIHNPAKEVLKLDPKIVLAKYPYAKL